MFNRKSYKSIARKQLGGRYATPVLATLFTMLIYLLLNTPSLQGVINALQKPMNIFEYSNGTNGSYSLGVRAFYSRSMPSFLFSMASCFVSGVLIMAQANLYILLSHTTEPRPFGDYIKGFSAWLEGFLGFLWYSLWIFLWSLLFFIPGIVKAYSYSQMFLIMAEYPKVGVTRAMRLSKILTKGYKGDLFIMSLSFLGWEILSALTFGILKLWLTPYKSMSFVNAYHALKAHAIKAGDLTEEDFTGTGAEA